MIKKQDLLKYSIAVIFLLFGALKFFPHLSPAEAICGEIVQKLTFYLIPQSLCIYALALYEVGIGLMLLSNKFMRVAIILAIVHLIFTFSPFILSPTEVFDVTVNSITLLGQYILKNLIIITALLMLYPSRKTILQ